MGDVLPMPMPMPMPISGAVGPLYFAVGSRPLRAGVYVGDVAVGGVAEGDVEQRRVTAGPV